MGRTLAVSLLLCVSISTPAHSAPVLVAKRPPVARPQPELGDGDLNIRYIEIWEHYAKTVEEASSKLQSEIEKNIKSATGSGNLDLALFWKAIAKEFEQQGELRWDAAALKKTWNERFGDASFPADFGVAVKKTAEAYASAANYLEKSYGVLVTEFTKAEKLEEALKLRGEIKEFLAAMASAPEPAPATIPNPEPKPNAVSPIVGMWISDGGWGNEFLADKTARNLTPEGQVDTVGTWKEEGQGRYSARLASWQWKIVFRGDEIEVTKFHNGQLRSHQTLKRRR